METIKMEIEVFNEILGENLVPILGQDRYYNSLSDSECFYEIPEWINDTGYYQGAVIRFYDLLNKKVYAPFKKKNVSYSYAKFKNNFFYFLKVDFNKNLVELIKYFPEQSLESIHKIPIEEVELYNLSLADGYEFHICSSSDRFISYYPRKFSIEMEPDQSVLYVDKDRLYINQWIEEGLEGDAITNDYKYYEKLLVMDLDGNLISERTGSLSLYPNGKWYLS